MTARTRVERRQWWTQPKLAIVAFVTTFILLGGSGAAFALWSANANVSSSATTATVQVSQALSGSSLSRTYSTTDLIGVGVVTVTNSSSRAGTFATTISSTSTSSSLRSAVSVAVGTAASCTTTATLGNQVTGTMASPVVYSANIAAGATVVLCVRTSMTTSGVTANYSASLAATVGTNVTVGTWTRSASTGISFTQAVEAAPVQSVVDSAAWYQVYVAGPQRCATVSGSSGQTSGCSAESQYQANRADWWRFALQPSGFYRVVSMNSSGMNSAWWSVPNTSVNTTITVGSGATSNQEWSLTDNGDGSMAIKLRAAQTMCAASGGNGNGSALRIEVCAANDVDQKWYLNELGDATPAQVALTCSGDGFTRYYSWPQLTYYEGEVTYRVYIGGILVNPHNRGTGYDPTVQFGYTPQFVTTYGTGSKVVLVQQSVGGAAYTTVGTGTLVISASTPYLQCG